MTSSSAPTTTTLKALARREAAGHDVTAIVTALAPSLTPGHDRADPAAQLATSIDRATASLPEGRSVRPRRVAGLIATPAEPVPADIQTALSARAALIEDAARRAAHDASEAGEDWIARLGRPSENPRARASWIAGAATVALYRHRYGIAGPAPLSNPKDITEAQQGAEARAAAGAVRRAQTAARQSTHSAQRRNAQRVDQGRRL